MSLTGEWAALRSLIGRLDAAGSDILPKATKAARAAVQEQYVSDFSRGVDPWGKKWPSARAGGAMPLVKSGALASAQFRIAGGNAIRVSPARYWVFHQVGANNMARRAVLPFSESRWDPPTMAVIHNVVIGYFRS